MVEDLSKDGSASTLLIHFINPCGAYISFQ